MNIDSTKNEPDVKEKLSNLGNVNLALLTKHLFSKEDLKEVSINLFTLLIHNLISYAIGDCISLFRNTISRLIISFGLKKKHPVQSSLI